MQNIYYKVSYKDSDKKNLIYSSEDINEATKFYNTVEQMSGISDVKFFVVNNVEEELTKEQLPSIKH